MSHTRQQTDDQKPMRDVDPDRLATGVQGVSAGQATDWLEQLPDVDEAAID